MQYKTQFQPYDYVPLAGLNLEHKFLQRDIDFSSHDGKIIETVPQKYAGAVCVWQRNYTRRVNLLLLLSKTSRVKRDEDIYSDGTLVRPGIPEN